MRRKSDDKRDVSVPLPVLEAALHFLDQYLLETADRQKDTALLNLYAKLRVLVEDAGGVVP